MPKSIHSLLKANQVWRHDLLARDSKAFKASGEGQAPTWFWLGCSDSRVSLELSTGRFMGEMFVHRNIANQFSEQDAACRASLSFALEALHIREVIVCGHYRCGGVAVAKQAQLQSLLTTATAQRQEEQAALDESIRVWLAPLGKLAKQHPNCAEDRLCELNVREQVARVENSAVVRRLRAKGEILNIHALIYDPASGQLLDLSTDESALDA